MKTIDFLKPGGFPVTLETLDFMQQAYNPALLAGFSDAGNTPVILSGMLPNPLGTTLSPGWCLIAGELLYCAGGVLNGGFSPFLVPQTVAGAVEFQDGNLQDAYFTKTAVLVSTTDSTPIGSVYLSAFQHWTNAMIANVRTRIKTSTIAFTANRCTGSATFRKDPFTGMVNLSGTLTVTNASTIVLPDIYYSLYGGQVAAEYRPLATVPFLMLPRYTGGTPPTEGVNGGDTLRHITAEIKSDGGMSGGILKASADYTAPFNITYPTW